MNRYSKFFVCYLSALFLISCASGSVIVTGSVRPATDPQTVKLYLKEPIKYEAIGLVEASSSAGWTEQGAQDYAIEELKKHAAKIGANGILLTATGEQVMWSIPTGAKIVKGMAIFVYEE